MTDHARKAEEHAESAGGHLTNAISTSIGAVDSTEPPIILAAAQVAATMALVEVGFSIAQRLADLTSRLSWDPEGPDA